MNKSFNKTENSCYDKKWVCRYVFKKVDAKICPRKKVMGKKRSQIGQFYRYFGDFSISHNFFSRIYAVLIFWYVVEMVEFYRSVYFQVNRAIQIFWPFSWNTLLKSMGMSKGWSDWSLHVWRDRVTRAWRAFQKMKNLKNNFWW